MEKVKKFATVAVLIIGAYVLLTAKVEAPMPKPSPTVLPSTSTKPRPSTGTVYCTPDQRKAEFCAEIYAPVCGNVEVQCIKEPCYPIRQTFGNACEACANDLVTSYTEGVCNE
ncbi:MAG: hypothetical protein AAB420_00995 [Patescibacteria group bacterium]